ncbi:hypothetical protein SAMN05216188_11955 [Lentzea xinjiangensis]|uniref:Alpha amylase inhibitor n=1 Tax=Lentzea xinjiangensis TaxID=402600 RepID=A0A1H9TTN9_9PSEU|nr:hypothetical protein [Lentzea xinjiangensis]SES00341.1 hypothetical protein SAMN05216188_11955 [Lentzea xinjiangensis]
MNRTRLTALAAAAPLAIVLGLGAGTASAAPPDNSRSIYLLCEAVTATPVGSLYNVAGVRCTLKSGELPLVGTYENGSIEQINTNLVYVCSTVTVVETDIPGTSNVVGTGCK